MIRFIAVVLTAAWVLASTVAPAHAGPVFAAIGAFFASSPFLAAVGKLLVSVALSRLQAALAPKPRQPGIKTESTSSGSQNPASFMLGLYATNGVAVCPPMSHGVAGKTPNAFLTYVIEVSDVPGCALSALIINGERCTLGAAHADYGPVVSSGTYANHAWVKFYDGTQTVADPMLVAKYSTYPERPWSSAMVGRGICYAIVTFLYDREVFSSFPEVRFELLGIPLYDPRKDTTVGGSGAHRLNNSATWERTGNPIIMAYNAHLGITLPGGHLWGGGMPQGDVPLASVFAAANACDALVDNGLGGTEPRFRAGYEVFVSDQPAEVCEELMKACLGEAADVGGFWKFQAGDPELPVFMIEDGDVLTSLSRERRPFPSIESTRNAIAGSFPDPAVQWEASEAPPIYNATWETQDGGRRRIVNVDFSAVPYLAQVQRNMRAMIADDRRFLTHGLPLPPEATVLEPLDTLSWTSDAYGYAAKTFEIVSTQENLRSGVVQVQLRERDPADTAIPGGYYVAISQPSTLPVIPAAQTVPSFAVSGTSILDSAGAARRPALQLTWEPDLPDVTGIMWEVRLQATGVIVARNSTQNVATGSLLVADGIVASTVYEARAKPVVDRPAAWTSWVAATTPATLITSPDLAVGSVSDEIQTVVLGPLNKTVLPTGTVIATLDIGAIGNGQGWERRVHFEARVVGVTWEIVLETRKAQLGAGFTAWNIVETYPINTADGTWFVFGDSGAIAQPADDFEYRLRASVGFTSGSSDVLRNVYMTAVRIIR
ncbi:MAG: hypothetical protein JNK34_05760 [Tabrizicola sp.]|nr:hypothetical protein [Tabrizicola sp.]